MAGRYTPEGPSSRRSSPLESYVRELLHDAGWTARRVSKQRAQQSGDGVRRLADGALRRPATSPPSASGPGS